MITHVIVKLDAPIEEKYWQDDNIFSNEYYGLGKPLTRCKECEHHGKRTNMCDIWHHYTSPEGYCHRGHVYGKAESSTKGEPVKE